jgi:hypothetical protein
LVPLLPDVGEDVLPRPGLAAGAERVLAVVPVLVVDRRAHENVQTTATRQAARTRHPMAAAICA